MGVDLIAKEGCGSVEPYCISFRWWSRGLRSPPGADWSGRRRAIARGRGNFEPYYFEAVFPVRPW